MWAEFLHIFSGSFLDAIVGQPTVQINNQLAVAGASRNKELIHQAIIC